MADSMYRAPVIPGPGGARRPRAGAWEQLLFPFDRRVLYDLETHVLMARRKGENRG